MPNATDFTVFKDAGDIGPNFAYIKCFPRWQASSLAVSANRQVSESCVNGKQIQVRETSDDPIAADRCQRIHRAPPKEVLESHLRTKTAASLQVTVWDQTNRFPKIDGFTTPPRPPYRPPKPFSDTDRDLCDSLVFLRNRGPHADEQPDKPRLSERAR